MLPLLAILIRAFSGGISRIISPVSRSSTWITDRPLFISTLNRRSRPMVWLVTFNFDARLPGSGSSIAVTGKFLPVSGEKRPLGAVVFAFGSRIRFFHCRNRQVLAGFWREAAFGCRRVRIRLQRPECPGRVGDLLYVIVRHLPSPLKPWSGSFRAA